MLRDSTTGAMSGTVIVGMLLLVSLFLTVRRQGGSDVRGLRGQRHRHWRDHDPGAAWGQRAAVAAVARQSGNSRDVASGGATVSAGFHGGGDGSARLRRQ